MNINSGIKQAVILTIGIIMLGFCIKSGLESVISKDRKVVVKGLAEKEVEADKVTWPIVSKEIGNDLPELYQKSMPPREPSETSWWRMALRLMKST